jgi:hypothetical protein
MSQDIGGVIHCRLDIGCLKMRVGLPQIVLCRTLAQLSEDQFHCDSCSTDYGFAQHDFRIDLDMVGSSHRLLSALATELFCRGGEPSAEYRQPRIPERIHRNYFGSITMNCASMRPLFPQCVSDHALDLLVIAIRL